MGYKGYNGYKGKRPQSKRLTASLFMDTYEIMKEKRKSVVILTGQSVGDVEMKKREVKLKKLTLAGRNIKVAVGSVLRMAE
eukprot:62872-Pelagomonas_calceolata.AAC.1